jgi:hypothetical protein
MFVDWKCVICSKMQIMDIFANVKRSFEFLRSAALQLSDLSELLWQDSTAPSNMHTDLISMRVSERSFPR